MYKSTCIRKETVPAMRENAPVICHEEGGYGLIMNVNHSQCHMTLPQIQVHLNTWFCDWSNVPPSGKPSRIRPLSLGCIRSPIGQYVKTCPLITAPRQKNSARYMNSMSVFLTPFPMLLSKFASFLTKERKWTSRIANHLA